MAKTMFSSSQRAGCCLALLLAMSSAEAVDASKLCRDKAVNAYEMNECAGQDLKNAEKKMNAVYQAVIKAHHDDLIFIGKFKAAQRAWLMWRDAELAAIYVEHSPGESQGTNVAMCRAGRAERLMMERTKQLRVWIEGEFPEGDVCTGSQPFKQEKSIRP